MLALAKQSPEADGDHQRKAYQKREIFEQDFSSQAHLITGENAEESSGYCGIDERTQCTNCKLCSLADSSAFLR